MLVLPCLLKSQAMHTHITLIMFNIVTSGTAVERRSKQTPRRGENSRNAWVFNCVRNMSMVSGHDIVLVEESAVIGIFVRFIRIYIDVHVPNL